MKQWFALTCPVCGFRYPLKKFNRTIKPIVYPLQLVSGGGRGKGFRVLEYLPWSTLPTLQQTDMWNSLLSMYNRLGAAYDNFYQVLGFLSPQMKTLLRSLKLQRSYADAYQPNSFQNYSQTYSEESTQDIAEQYRGVDYTDAYATLPTNLFPGGIQDE